MLELAYKPDAAQAAARMEAWWNGAILDRATVQVTAPGEPRYSAPVKHHATLRERWLDFEHQVACAQAWLGNTYWGGEILPQWWPNLGPEIMTASLGAELEFSEGTSWSVPMLHDWEKVPSLRVDPGNPYFARILEGTRLSLEAGKGKWVTGHTDLHPGADLAASLRDPEQFAIDLALEPERCEELMEQLRPTFFEAYDLQYEIMRQAGQAVTTSWLPLFAEGRYYIPSNDFSCMVSPAMFERFFLQEIVDEVEFLDRSIYHLDGPGALQHLDTLLDIPGLGAIQWVWGAGHDPGSAWMDVFKRIQAAGKGIHASIHAWEIDLFMQELNPEGVMLCMGAASREEADAIIARFARWTRKGVY